ncbi:hypothetical protein CROQUDRAFT_100417 [Cronartium quercuum f. sp. fusiforme G11]|uniref:Uncharacterized protein n=1 Tax=Cronartium quercuum f. sp. fusiforme G11 TaxID=708437 RepID=A0A9P6T796_9BASI|nr:hypothetical protein CROQUDRAFT_100417 [Cronartium quercuum f. sp. fusiforme G11]
MSIVWTPPPNNLAGPVNSKGSSEPRSLLSSPGLFEDVKEKQERTGQALPGGHVTELRSHGTPISRLLPGLAEPVKAGIMLGINLLSSRSGRVLEDTTMLVSFLKMTIRCLYVMQLAKGFPATTGNAHVYVLKTWLMQVFDTFCRLKPNFMLGRYWDP